VDKVGYVAKAIAGFIVGVVGVIIARVTTGDAVVPPLDPFDFKDWAVLVGMGVLGYLGVYVPRNRLNTGQVTDGLKKLPVHERAAAIGGAARHRAAD
jgi:hypothetical protein